MIEKIINADNLETDAPARQLISILETIYNTGSLGDDITIYHNFPSYPSGRDDAKVSPNILVVGKKIGVNIFQCVKPPSSEIDWIDYENSVDEIDRTLFAQLLKLTPEIVKKSTRSLICEFRTNIYIPEENAEIITPPQFHGYANDISSVKNILTRGNEYELLQGELDDLKATLDGSKSIKRPTKRPITNPSIQKYGKILNEIENEISIFDREQRKAALITLNGPLRIRGLAGSGKTVILARKVAVIHEQQPNAKILFTYNTKALGDHVKSLITRFYRESSDQDPNWDNIHIMHAWGGAGMEGVYYNACKDNGIAPINLLDAKKVDYEHPFDFICGKLLSTEIIQRYDYCLIDEAQDFPKNFYRLCYRLTRNQRIVWAYDDFQNILNIDIQNEKETFGKNSSGEYCIDFSESKFSQGDVILHRCYRNPRLILITAFSLGLGVYSTGKIVQRIGTNKHWEDLGFTVDEGDSEAGSNMKISRPSENSSGLKNEYLNIADEVISVKSFPSLTDELTFICESISKDISSGLMANDISIICLDHSNIKTYLAVISANLMRQNIGVFDVYNGATNKTLYHLEGSVTFSTVYKAKGNESGKVYVIGVDRVFRTKNNPTERNKLFTAITRAKGWITITGVGTLMNDCLAEYTSLLENNFTMAFVQPTENEVRTIQHDMDEVQRKMAEFRESIEDLAKKMGIPYEDLIRQMQPDTK